MLLLKLSHKVSIYLFAQASNSIHQQDLLTLAQYIYSHCIPLLTIFTKTIIKPQFSLFPKILGRMIMEFPVPAREGKCLWIIGSTGYTESFFVTFFASIEANLGAWGLQQILDYI